MTAGTGKAKIRQATASNRVFNETVASGLLNKTYEPLLINKAKFHYK